MSREVWKVVPGFKAYAVSNRGRIKRIAPASINAKSGRAGHAKVGRILKQRPTNWGYKSIWLHMEGKGFSRLVHVLVALAFIGPKPTPRHEVAHWNNRPADNRSKNLRWATSKQNCADKERHGTQPRGMDYSNAKLTDSQVRKIRALFAKGRTQAELARKFNVSDGFMCRLCNNERRQHV